jgi:hypothetical protein
MDGRDFMAGLVRAPNTRGGIDRIQRAVMKHGRYPKHERNGSTIGNFAAVPRAGDSGGHLNYLGQVIPPATGYSGLPALSFRDATSTYLTGTSSFFSKLRKLTLSMQTCSMMSHFGFN